jgi:hypothetical protein
LITMTLNLQIDLREIQQVIYIHFKNVKIMKEKEILRICSRLKRIKRHNR